MGAVQAALLPIAAAAALGCSQTTPPEFVAELPLTPDSVHLALGAAAEFTALPLGPRGQDYSSRSERVAWVSADPDVATVDTDMGPSTTVQAHTLGETTLRATLGRGEGAARIFVHPVGLASIAIDPASPTLARAMNTSVRAVLLDAQGDTLSPDGFRISWSVSDEDLALLTGEVGPIATLFGRAEGQVTLRLIVGDRSVATTVAVTP